MSNTISGTKLVMGYFGEGEGYPNVTRKEMVDLPKDERIELADAIAAQQGYTKTEDGKYTK